MTEAKRIAPYSQPRITLAVSPQALAILKRLQASGLFGISLAAVTRELVYKSLREMVVVERMKIP